VIDLPVVEIQVSGFDVIRALYQAKQKTEKIAVVGFEPFTCGLDELEEILGIDLKIVPLKKVWYDQPQYIEEQLQMIREQQYNCVVGDNISVKIAQQLGMLGFLIKSGKEALIQAIFEAERVAHVRKQEMEKAKRIKSIIDLSFEGILSIDQNGIIDTFNPRAEDIFSVKAYKVIGKNIENVFPTMKLLQTFESGHQEKEKVLDMGDTKIVANVIPIKIDNEVVQVVATFQKVSQIQRMEQRIREELYLKGLTADNTFSDIVGHSEVIEQVKEEAWDYAQIDLPILIYGETGTGKELFAQAIHNASARRNKPFVAFNCAALPESLLESELFGYVEGAFTGAKKHGRAGLFEQAHGGTIFLDEIGEIPKDIQARLLRVLQDRKIRRLGDDKITPVDVRIIVATNKNLARLVDEKTFREDLYYRINVLNLNLPSLCERKEDIPILVNFFIQKHRNRMNKIVKGLSQRGIRILEDYDWPGNIRQLENIIERLMVRTKEDYIRAELVKDVMKSLRGYTTPELERAPSSEKATSSLNVLILPLDKSLAEMEKLIIRRVVQEEHGDKIAGAERLHIGRTTLWRKLKE
jgi:PAS domain S-box-containing protein